MATIHDVARLAEVSNATVSRVISGDPTLRVSDETRSRVWDCALKLKYWPRPASKRRAANTGGAAPAAGGALACVLSLTLEKYSDPFFTEVLSGAEQRLQKQGLFFSVVRTYNELMQPSVLAATLSQPVAGLLLLEEVPVEVLAQITARVPHVVGVDTFFEGIDNVGFDRYDAAVKAVEHLLARGRRRIGFIGGSGTGRPLDDSHRFAGYRRCLRRAGLPLEEALVKNCLWRQDLAQQCTRELLALEAPPDAIFCANDQTATAALSVIYEHGIRVPDQLSIIGVHNNEIASYTSPPLTTIDVHPRQIGETAAEVLLARLEGDTSVPKNILLQTGLVVRGST